MALGVTVGVGVAELIVRFLGTGTLQLALVTALALAAAVFLSTATTFVVQAAVTGALVVAIGPGSSVAPNRFFEAVLGAAIALLFSQVLFPVDVMRRVRSPADGAVNALASALRCVAAAVSDGDEDGAAEAQRAVRQADLLLTDLEDAITLARRATRTSPVRHRDAADLQTYRRVADRLHGVLTDVRPLVMTAAELSASRGPGSRAMGQALSHLGALVEGLRAGESRARNEQRPTAEAVAAAAAAATEADPRELVVSAAALARSAARRMPAEPFQE